MKSFSVQQIADMLQTNPETVRRWIRDKKLNAVQVSRKDGNVVTDAELQRFLKASPKYMPRFTASLASSLVAAGPAVSLPLLIGSLIGGKVAGYMDEKKKLEVRIRPEDIEQYIKETIAQHSESIKSKKTTIKHLEEEIQSESLQIEQLQYLLEHKELLSESENQKK